MMSDDRILSLLPVIARSVTYGDLLRWEEFLRLHPDVPSDLACLVRQARIFKELPGNL